LGLLVGKRMGIRRQAMTGLLAIAEGIGIGAEGGFFASERQRHGRIEVGQRPARERIRP